MKIYIARWYIIDCNNARFAIFFKNEYVLLIKTRNCGDFTYNVFQKYTTNE